MKASVLNRVLVWTLRPVRSLAHQGVVDLPYPSTLLEFCDANSRYTSPVRLTIDGCRADSNCAYYRIQFDFDISAALTECRALEPLYCDHRSEDRTCGYEHRGWQSLTLHGIDKHKTKHFTHYGFTSFEDAGYHWTDVCSQAPTLCNFLRALPYARFHRVRIMKLAPGGYIMPHQDGEGRAFGPLNIAINNPPGCRFVIRGGGVVPFEPGIGMVLDVARTHAVINQSDEARYHVIVHGEYAPHMRYL